MIAHATALVLALVASEGKAVIEGKITPAGAAVSVSALDRDVPARTTARTVPLKEYKGTVAPDGTSFKIEVPPGTYDLHVELEDGRALEGADLRIAAEGPPLKERDVKAIKDRIAKMRMFYEEKHVVAVAGAGERARVLVVLIRKGPTSYDGRAGGPVGVFRAEVWAFRKHTGSWVRKGTVRVLRRFLVKRDELPKYRDEWRFLPELGGVDVKAGEKIKKDVIVPPASAKAEREPAR